MFATTIDKRSIMMAIIDKLKLDTYKNLTVLNEPSDYDVFHGCKTALSKNHDAIFIYFDDTSQLICILEIKYQPFVLGVYHMFSVASLKRYNEPNPFDSPDTSVRSDDSSFSISFTCSS